MSTISGRRGAVCDTVGIIHKERKLLLVADQGELLARYATSVALTLDRPCVALRPSLVGALEQAEWVTAVTWNTIDETAVRVTVIIGQAK
ncbi:MAG: hypothetical protein H6661_08510 [Ardenticatenaceae bacterium]|nr:hypothetical protein [Ardenticatenaceae bacterium]